MDPSYSFKINAFWHYSPKNYELFEHRTETLAEMHLSKMLGFMQVDNVLYHDANIFTEYKKIYPDIELKNNLNISDTIISLFENGLDTAISNLLERGLIKLPDFSEIKGIFLRSIAFCEEKLFQLITQHYSSNIDQMPFENNILIALAKMSEDAQNINAMSSILNSMWKRVNENGGQFLAKIIFNHYISTEDYQKLPIIFNTNSAQTVFNSMLKQHEKIGTQVIKNLINSGMNFDPLTEDGKKNFDKILSLPKQDNVENIKFIIDHYKLYNTEYLYELCYDFSTNNNEVVRSFATGACTPDSVEIYTHSENDEKLKIDVSKFKLPMFCASLLIEGIGPKLLHRSQHFFSEVSSYLPYRVFLGEIDGHIWSKKLQDICNDKSTTWESIENHINNLDEIGLLLINIDKLDEAVFANINNDKFTEGFDDEQIKQFRAIETEEGAKIFVENAILNYFKKHYISLESHNLEYTEYMPVWSVLKSIDNIRLESKCEAFIDRILANYEQDCRCSNIYLPPEYKLFSYISDSFVKQNETRLPIELLYNLVRFGDTSPNSLSTETLSELYAYSHIKFGFLCMLSDNEALHENVIKFVKLKFEDKFMEFQFTNMDMINFYYDITEEKSLKKILEKLTD